MKHKLLPTLAIVFAFSLSGCGGSTPGGGEHVHHFSTTWCYNQTDHWHECNGCDEVSEKAAHTFGELIVDTPATEFEDGVGHYTCTVCAFTKTTTIPKTHVHSYPSTWTYNDAYHWHECSCGKKEGTAVHTFGEVIVDVPPTEDTPGEGHKECSVCGYIKHVTIPAEHAHHYSETWSYDSGYHWHQCSCGDVIDKAPHTFSEDWIIDQPATATEEGIKHRTCDTCDYTDIQTIPAGEIHEHHYSEEWSYDIGWHWHQCSCGDVIDKDFHTFSNGWTIDKPATATEDGSQHRTCDTCPYTETQVIPAGSGPVWATAIEITPETATVDPGGSVQFTAILTPSDAQGRVSWETDYAHAYIDEKGLLTAYGYISQTVTAPVIAKIYSPLLEDYLEARAYVTINSGTVDPGPGPSQDDDPNPENETVNFQRFFLNEDGQSYYMGGIKKETTSIIIPHYFKGLPVTYIDEIYNWVLVDGEYVCYSDALESITIPTSITGIHQYAWSRNPFTHLIYEGTKADFVRINEGPILEGVTCSDGVFSDNMTGPEIEQYQTIYYNGFKLYFTGFEIEFSDYTGEEKEISIPATYNGIPVKSFSATNISLGLNNLETIHVNSLYGPRGNINAPNLKKITIGYNVKDMSCPTTNVPFENDVTYEIDELCIIKDNNGLFMREDDPTTILYCHSSGSVVVPNGVTTIQYQAFYGLNVTSVSLPDTLTTIGSYAFTLSHITSITLPDSVTEVGALAFLGCRYLESATLSNGMDLINYQLFEDCSALRSISIPESITVIEYGAFFDCSSLESIVIPDSVTKLSSHIFVDCRALKSITFSNGLTEIADGTCHGCNSLTNVKLPDNLVEIGFSAFSDCPSLASLELPDSLLYIGQGAFAWCSNLSSINIPTNLLAIGEFAFYDTLIPPTTIPETVEEIGCGAFYGLDVTSDSFGEDSRFIYDDGVVFNKSKTWLYHYNISNTAEVYEIPDTVKVIGSGAFSGRNRNLKTVIIPKDVKFLQEGYLDTVSDFMRIGAFFEYSKYNRLTVYYKGSVSDWEKISISERDSVNDDEVSTIYYYSDYVPSDTSHTYWHYVDGVPTLWK